MKPVVVEAVACGSCGRVFTGTHGGVTSAQAADKCCRCDGCGCEGAVRSYYRDGKYFCPKCMLEAELRAAKAKVKRVKQELEHAIEAYETLKSELQPTPKKQASAPNFDEMDDDDEV